MLTNLENKIAALQKFSFKDETIAIIEANKDKLADLQAEQLAKGVRSDGRDINPQYADSTIGKKEKLGIGLGRITSHVTFFNTGELYRKLRADISGSKFSIKADTFKFDKMIKRSGVNTVGLNVESRTEFIENVTRPGILNAYKRKVQDV